MTSRPCTHRSDTCSLVEASNPTTSTMMRPSGSLRRRCPVANVPPTPSRTEGSRRCGFRRRTHSTTAVARSRTRRPKRSASRRTGPDFAVCCAGRPRVSGASSPGSLPTAPAHDRCGRRHSRSARGATSSASTSSHRDTIAPTSAHLSADLVNKVRSETAPCSRERVRSRAGVQAGRRPMLACARASVADATSRALSAPTRNNRASSPGSSSSSR